MIDTPHTDAANEPIDLAQSKDFALGEILVRPALREIEHASSVQRIEPRVMQVLVALAEAKGGVVSRESLQARCWNGTTVGDDALNRVVMKLRRIVALEGDDALEVETIPRVGYRLKAASAESALSRPAPATPPEPAVPAGPRIAIFAAAAATLLIALGGGLVLLRPTDRPDGEGAKTPGPSAGLEQKADGSIRLAVIPFIAMSSDADDQHFADGLSEELLNWLANVEGLEVPGRTSSFYFRDKTGDLRDIGERLGVDYVLEGSVRKSETSLRIAAQLIDVRTGYHLWSKVYEKERSDIFAIQDQIARTVVTELLGKIPESGAANPAAVGEVDPKAHELYLKGRALWARRQGMLALEKFRAAVAVDSRHALAQAFVAVIASNAVANGYSPPGLANPDPAITNALAEAVRLKPNAADVLFAKAWVAEHRSGRPPGSPITDRSIIDTYEAAVRANPRHVEALHALTRAEPLPEKKIGLYERILEIDPGHPAARGNLIIDTLAVGDRAKAALLIRQGLILTPDDRQPMTARAKVLGDLALFGEAAFGDWAAIDRDNYQRSIAAALLADLGAAPEARFLYMKVAQSGDPAWESYRVGAAALDGDAGAELTAAEAFYRGGELSHYSTWMLANALIRTGDYARAYEVIVARRPAIAEGALDKYHPYWDEFADLDVVAAAHALGLAGRRDEARMLWKALLPTEPLPESGLPWMDFLRLALIHSHLGDDAEAVKFFRAAYDAGFRYLAGYNCGDCIYDGFSAEHGLFAPLVAIPENKALVEKIKAENAATLEKFNKQYGVLDRVREMMAAEAVASGH